MQNLKATNEEVNALLKIQEIDIELMRINTQLNEIPEIPKIAACRKKRKEIKGKQDGVISLADEAEEKLTRLQKEEEKLIEQINALQKKLDGSKDHRIVGSITKEMQGQTKRQQENAKEQEELLERQIKIDNLADEIAAMLASVDEKEEKFTQEFKKKAGALKQKQANCEEERAKLVGQVPSFILSAYDDLCKEKGGVGLAHVENDYCSACHTEFSGVQLNSIRSADGLSECPNCHRLMSCF